MANFPKFVSVKEDSLFKLIWKELLLYTVTFSSISVIYRFALQNYFPEFATIVRNYIIFFGEIMAEIPLSGILLIPTFFVSYLAYRWWYQYTSIPWPDKVMHLVAFYIEGEDEEGRMLRRSLMRYVNLSLIFTLRFISVPVKKRFPTADHLVESGFLTPHELQIFKSVPNFEFNSYLMPCTWFNNLLKKACHTNRLSDHHGLEMMMKEFIDFRSKCGMLSSYNSVSIPSVYTHVVFFCTYSYFLIALIGKQSYQDSLEPLTFIEIINQYFPFSVILEFVILVGLLKVAEKLLNPFGNDDDDFELNSLIDRHTWVSTLGVDSLMKYCPPLVNDITGKTVELEIQQDDDDTLTGSVVHLGGSQSTILETPRDVVRTDLHSAGQEAEIEDEYHQLLNWSTRNSLIFTQKQ